MLTSAVVNDVVNKLNEEFNLPLISEETEGAWIEKLVVLIDSHLPPWVAQFMASAADGLTAEELKVHEDVIVTDLCKRINMSRLLPDFVEAKLIRYAVNAVLEYARVGFMAPGV
jgi:hypothetical protein